MSLKRLGKRLKRHLIREGAVACPSCGGELQLGHDIDEQVVRCGACGRLVSVAEVMACRGRGPAAVRGPVGKPAGTKIVRRELKDGAVGWEVPASGKSGGLLAFGVLWLTFSLVVGLVMSIGFLAGGKGWISLFPVGMSLLFIGVGVAMTWFGLRGKYAKNLIVVKRDSVVLVRSLFGRRKVRTVSRKGLKWVKKQVFYEQNYEPVYGVEVKGADGKLRFGSTLEEEEKNWLVSELRGEIGDDQEAARKWPRAERFVMTLPERKGGAELAGIAIGITVSLVFGLIGVFLLKDAGFFRYVWTGFSGFILVMCLVGLVRTRQKAGVVIEVVVGKTSVGVRRKKGGHRTAQEDVPREGVEAVRAYEGGGRNNRTGYCLEILTRDRALVVVEWENREGLPEFGRELSGRLGIADA